MKFKDYINEKSVTDVYDDDLMQLAMKKKIKTFDQLADLVNDSGNFKDPDDSELVADRIMKMLSKKGMKIKD